MNPRPRMTFWTEVREGLFISWAAIRANKMRSSLTTLGVVIGIVTVTLMGTAIQGINESFKQTISGLGSDVLYVQRFSWFSGEPWWKIRNRRIISMEYVHAIERQATMARVVVPETFSRETVQRKNRTSNGITIVGTTDKDFMARGFTIGEGRFMTAGEVEGSRPICVLGADIAKNFFPNESPLGQKIKVGGFNFEVVGVMASLDKFLGLGDDNHLLVPISQLQSHFFARPDIQILVKVTDMKLMEDAKEEIRGIMRKARNLAPGAPDDFGVNQQDALLKQFQTVGGSMAAAGLGITGLSLFVGGIGIMNIMFVSVAERTREIGVRKAIGAKRRTILIQFLIEAASICLLGGIIGLAIALPITITMQKFLKSSLSIEVAVLALVVSILTGVISGFLPAWRAARMNPVDALRSE